MNKNQYRLIDASINRAAEGLRYMEDIARFLLDNAELTETLKNMRHALIPDDWQLHKYLLSARNTAGDVGVEIKAAGRKESRDLMSSVIANARRVQESLRTLAEITKVEQISNELTSGQLEKIRYSLYTVEKNLLSQLERNKKRERVNGLYIIIDSKIIGNRNPVLLTRQAIKGGAKTIQLRDKIHDRGEMLPLALELKKECEKAGVLYIINDYLDLAMAVEADGVHLGQTDLPVKLVRKIAPIDMIIGCSVFNVEQALKAEAEGADYVAPGAIFSTSSKNTKVIGIKALREIAKAVNIPVVAIGGINIGNAARVKKAGADSIAVISAVVSAISPDKACKEIINKFEEKNG